MVSKVYFVIHSLFAGLWSKSSPALSLLWLFPRIIGKLYPFAVYFRQRKCTIHRITILRITWESPRMLWPNSTARPNRRKKYFNARSLRQRYQLVASALFRSLSVLCICPPRKQVFSTWTLVLISQLTIIQFLGYSLDNLTKQAAISHSPIRKRLYVRSILWPFEGGPPAARTGQGLDSARVQGYSN